MDLSYLGIDVGTTGCKVIAFDEEGRTVAQAYRAVSYTHLDVYKRQDGTMVAQSYREYPFITPQPGWLEINPEHIWESVLDALNEATKKSKEPIEVVAVTSHGETLIPIDRSGKALYNALANFDTRAHTYICLLYTS